MKRRLPTVITVRAGPDAGSPNIHLCWPCGWFGCLRADRPVMAGQRARMPALVPCEHFPEEDPTGTAGRPGSSPAAPATHSAGADHPACGNPQAEHRCSGNWTLWLCRRLGCYRSPARRPRSRADPRRPPRHRAAELLRAVVLCPCGGTHRDASIKQQPGHPAARRTPAPAAPVTSTSPLTKALLSVPRCLAPAAL